MFHINPIGISMDHSKGDEMNIEGKEIKFADDMVTRRATMELHWNKRAGGAVTLEQAFRCTNGEEMWIEWEPIPVYHNPK